MNSKNLLILVSGFVVVGIFMSNYLGTFKLCGAVEYGACMDTVAGIIVMLSPFIPLFLFSVLTYFMRQEVYASWFAFVRIWIPLSLVAIFLAPEYSHDWMYRVEKGTVALAMSAIFVIVSLCILAYGYMRQSRR